MTAAAHKTDAGSLPVWPLSQGPSPTHFMREPQVLAVVPFSHATLWRRVKAKKFPAPYKLAPNVTAWSAREVDVWCRSLPRTGT
jgi:predicted DNA-binding transcriptional regulator AlpA